MILPHFEPPCQGKAMPLNFLRLPLTDRAERMSGGHFPATKYCSSSPLLCLTRGIYYNKGSSHPLAAFGLLHPLVLAGSQQVSLEQRSNLLCLKIHVLPLKYSADVNADCSCHAKVVHWEGRVDWKTKDPFHSRLERGSREHPRGPSRVILGRGVKSPCLEWLQRGRAP